MLSPGAAVGEHVIVRRAAVGATSDVYEARSSSGGASVALKVLSPQHCLHAQMVARFLNEARTLQQLQHPHLVKVLSAGLLPEGPPFMVLEWLPMTLHQWLSQLGGRLPERDGHRVIQQLAQVLAMLHEHGLVHRDLKPANVLMVHAEPGAAAVKLADLGLAKRLPQTEARTAALPVSTAGGALLGTWEYMAPEQWVDAKHVDPKVDVYALGILWFQLLTGRLPFGGSEAQHLMFSHVGQPPPLQWLEPHAPALLGELIGRMLAKRPSARPELSEVLELLTTVGD